MGIGAVASFGGVGAAAGLTVAADTGIIDVPEPVAVAGAGGLTAAGLYTAIHTSSQGMSEGIRGAVRAQGGVAALAIGGIAAGIAALTID